jgi:hypothetical protein
MSPFWLCQPCSTFFKEDGSEIVFRPDSKSHLYWLHINVKENKTELSSMRNPKSMTVEEQMDIEWNSKPTLILSCKPAIKGVTPQNMYQKLKTLLTFS